MNCLMNGTTQRKGSVLVEFALILPILITLILGIIEVGWALFVQNTLADGAREGARVAVTHSDIAYYQIVAKVDAILANAHLPHATITITPVNFSNQPRGADITVGVSMPYKKVSILPSPLFLGGVILSSYVTMIKEY